MISILRTNDEEAALRKELKRQEELRLGAIGAYGTAVEAFCEHVVRVFPSLIDRHGPEFRRIAEEVHPEMSVSDLEKSRRRLQRRLEKFGGEASAEYEALAKDIRDTLRMATMATESLETSTQGSGEEWGRFAGEMDRIASIGDLQEVRACLRREVAHMNECMQTMARDNALVIGRLQGELAAMRKRVARAEALAEMDPLTELRNRRGIEAALEERTERGEAFCIVMFDIKRFRAINERYGSETGDEVLRAFARRLLSGIREGDLAGRWECDRFLALIDCPMNIVIQRARQMHGRVSGRYEIGVKPNVTTVEVQSSMGVVEYKPGDSARHIMERADKLLVAAKGQ
jgi:diguanylate cyclase (GGDEF)-like protein